MAVKKTQKKQQPKQTKATLGQVVMVFTKGSSNWCALVEPKIVDFEGLKFIEGIQVTGKEGHRMERKRTLMPFDQVASIVEFENEDALWSVPQPKHVPSFEENKNPLLTSHEQPQPHHGERHGNRHGRNRRRHQKGPDARFQEQYDSMRRNRG